MLNSVWYIDFDYISDCYGIFHVDSGFCRGLYSSKIEAEFELARLKVPKP
jgi:hypothetical protein